MSVTPLDMADIINLVENDLSAVVTCTKVPYLEQGTHDTTRTQTQPMICEQYTLMAQQLMAFRTVWRTPLLYFSQMRSRYYKPWPATYCHMRIGHNDGTISCLLMSWGRSDYGAYTPKL